MWGCFLKTAFRPAAHILKDSLLSYQIVTQIHRDEDVLRNGRPSLALQALSRLYEPSKNVPLVQPDMDHRI